METIKELEERIAGIECAFCRELEVHKWAESELLHHEYSVALVDRVGLKHKYGANTVQKVYYAENGDRGYPLNYCPMCGRKFGDDE